MPKHEGTVKERKCYVVVELIKCLQSPSCLPQEPKERLMVLTNIIDDRVSMQENNRIPYMHEGTDITFA